MADADSPRANRHRSRRQEEARRNGHRKKRSHTRRSEIVSDDTRGDRGSSSYSLSADALAQLNEHNVRQQRHTDRERRKRGSGHTERNQERAERIRKRERERERERERTRDGYRERERSRDRNRDRGRHREVPNTDLDSPPKKKPRKPAKPKKSRVVSGAVMEEGMAAGFAYSGLRGGKHNREESYDSLQKDYYRTIPKKKKSKKKLWIILGIVGLILLIVIIVVAVVVSKNNSSNNSSSSSGSSSSSSGLGGQSRSSIPTQWQNTYLDPFTWASTTDFNTTFTAEMVGNLPVMGLYSSWDDSAQANSNVPPLNKPWGDYTKTPARGVNLGGWLSLEPFITPSLFTGTGVVDEYTLCKSLGSQAGNTIEKHYNTFVTESTFKDIADAGLDHVRIPYSYWAVEVYDSDPYVFRTSWRYLLRGIEWARKYGLRVNLDLHALPGSQNGWNHSGRLGPIGWLNGTNGQTNAQRSTDIHDRLSQFFAQPRYKNIITHYGLANEPRMTFLKASDVISWTENAYNLVRKNGISALVIFGDGFMGLDNWQGQMQGYSGLVLDVHQYVIFNENQIDFTHQKKVQYACDGWTQQAEQSQATSTGYGPTLFAEWSQADTDCAKYVTNVGWGNRWEGSLNTGNASSSILTPRCPTQNSQCSCSGANADPSKWSSQYKSFLQMFAEAQMHSFEKGWGWWYWTWKTESSPQWSYEAGLAAGVLPSKAYQRDFNCDKAVPDFSQSGLPEYY